MPKTESLDELIAQKAAEFADQIRAAAEMADKEEEIRIEVEKQLAFIQKDAGVKLEGRHEFTVAKGRADSVYQRVIIEYKNPKAPGARIGPKGDSPGTKKVVEQLKNRFYDMQRELGHPLNSMFGVGLDGNYFVFIRFRDNKWQPQEPVEVNKYSAERFLWALYNLGQKGKPFSSEYLAGDFGSDSKLAQDGVRTLYEAISTTDHPKAQVFFNQWKILFGEVCGYDVDNPSDKIKKLAQSYGIEHRRKLKPAELLFAVHSYYGLFMKLLASEIVAFFNKWIAPPLDKMMVATSSKALKREMDDLEAGSVFRHLNITNFLEGDLFSWYTSVWSEPIEHLVRAMVTKLDDYNPGTFSEEPASSRDLLKKLYQQLFPRSVRHDLGEYYTPDWLAEHVLNELEYVGDPDKRLLDPACGSGTFLVMAINRIRKWYDEHREEARFDEGDLCRKILSNVIGFDLNPLAVMAARTNYLIAIRDLVGHVDKVEIPIYLCDSIMTPSEYGGLFAGALGKAKELNTAAAKFLIPTEIATHREHIASYAEQLEFCIRNSYSPAEFLERCRDAGLMVTEETLHSDLYQELVKLDKANKNGVWARIIKNAFAPLFVGEVDLIAGNPPWVIWDNLPQDYRHSTKRLWERYGLFTLSASEARHGGGKKDISMLMLYGSVDNYLATGGKLGFVITQTLFQTKGAGDGFRRFRIGNKEFLNVLRVHDMVRFQPFEGASNWTSTILLQKGARTSYPLPYYKWQLIGTLPEQVDGDWEENFKQEQFLAEPIDKNRDNSPWMLRPQSVTSSIDSLVGPSDFHAHLGANSGGANGVYWVQILSEVPGGVLIENMSQKSKTTLNSVRHTIEKDLLYPLMRWGDVRRYFAEPSAYIVLAQDAQRRTGIDERTMKKAYSKTYEYLKQFEPFLRKRAAYKRYQGGAPFYSMYDVGSYTLAPIKVVWRRMDKRINAVVVGERDDDFIGRRPIIPQETCVFVEVRSLAEAYYLSAVLNSAVVNFIVKSHSVAGGKGFGTPSMLDYARLKHFDARVAIHKQLSEAAQRAHELAASGKEIEDVQNEIDYLSGQLWSIKPAEVKAMRATLDS